jgi:acetamidase/formamidase
VTHAAPGDYIVFETRDAFDNQFDWNTTSDQVPACDLNRVHPMTGPVHIEGAERGDRCELRKGAGLTRCVACVGRCTLCPGCNRDLRLL